MARTSKSLILAVAVAAATALACADADARRGRGHHHGSRVGVFIGVPLGYWAYGPWPYYPPYHAYPYRYSYPAPAYVVPPVVVEPTYVQRDPGYRYYCRNPAGFYPEVTNCNERWLKVVSEEAAPEGTHSPAPSAPPPSR